MFVLGNGICRTCGGDMQGDGVTEVLHCEFVDVTGSGYEPDAEPVECREVLDVEECMTNENADLGDEGF